MRKYIVYSFALLMIVLFLFAKRCSNKKRIAKELQENPVNQTKDKQPLALDRNPAVINYSQHAQCRMACRQIDSTEVVDILQNGTINFKKSNLQASNCEKRYAVDGYGKRDNQHIRIVVVPCGNIVTVITCIDLEVDWACSCGDDKN